MIRQGSKWLMKPPLGTGLDLSHPFASSGVQAGYLLNEGGGTLVGDFSGNNNTGTFTGAPVWQSGFWGGQLGGFSTSNYVVLDPAKRILHATYPSWHAVLCVCNTFSPGYATFGGNSNGGAFTLSAILCGDTFTRYNIRDDPSNNIVSITVTTSISTDNLVHLICGISYTASSHALLLDGVTIGTDTSTTLGTTTIDQLTLGVQRGAFWGLGSSYPGSILWAGFGNGGVPDFASLWADVWAPYLTPTYRRWYAPSAVAGSKLFRPATLSLGSGGPFFATPANG